MTDFAWGLIGPGAIAHRFADAVHRLPGTYLHSVWGRDPARAAGFAAHWARQGKPAPQAVGSLEALLADAQIRAVYIATPHASHAPFIAQCLQAGKAVLCEKPLVTNATTARDLAALARQQQVFLMEALWTRFLPVYTTVGNWLRNGAIGRVQAIQATFCFNVPFDAKSRLFDPEAGGGCLLDIGIYIVAMARWVEQTQTAQFGAPTIEHATARFAPSGVEQRVTATLRLASDIRLQFVCAFDGSADNALQVFGERGHIRIAPRFWEAEAAVLERPGHAPEWAHAPHRINGFEGEVEEAMRCIQTGLIESPHMPLADTIATLDCLDALRAAISAHGAPRHIPLV